MTMPTWNSWMPGLLAALGLFLALAGAVMWVTAPLQPNPLPAPAYPTIVAMGASLAFFGWSWRWQVEQETDEAFAACIERQILTLAQLAEDLDAGARDCFGIVTLSLTHQAFDRYMAARHPGRTGASEVQVHGVLVTRTPRHPDLTVVQTVAIDTHDLMPTGT